MVGNELTCVSSELRKQLSYWKVGYEDANAASAPNPRRPKKLSRRIPSTTIFSSDLLTPEEERELLAHFWECKSELVQAA